MMYAAEDEVFYNHLYGLYKFFNEQIFSSQKICFSRDTYSRFYTPILFVLIECATLMCGICWTILHYYCLSLTSMEQLELHLKYAITDCYVFLFTSFY